MVVVLLLADPSMWKEVRFCYSHTLQRSVPVMMAEMVSSSAVKRLVPVVLSRADVGFPTDGIDEEGGVEDSASLSGSKTQPLSSHRYPCWHQSTSASPKTGLKTHVWLGTSRILHS
jgi:hypothetical protein